jgi:hypothetical protein
MVDDWQHKDFGFWILDFGFWILGRAIVDSCAI